MPRAQRLQRGGAQSRLTDRAAPLPRWPLLQQHPPRRPDDGVDGAAHDTAGLEEAEEGGAVRLLQRGVADDDLAEDREDQRFLALAVPAYLPLDHGHHLGGEPHDPGDGDGAGVGPHPAADGVVAGSEEDVRCVGIGCHGGSFVGGGEKRQPQMPAAGVRNGSAVQGMFVGTTASQAWRYVGPGDRCALDRFPAPPTAPETDRVVVVARASGTPADMAHQSLLTRRVVAVREDISVTPPVERAGTDAARRATVSAVSSALTPCVLAMAFTAFAAGSARSAGRRGANIALCTGIVLVGVTRSTVVLFHLFLLAAIIHATTAA